MCSQEALKCWTGKWRTELRHFARHLLYPSWMPSSCYRIHKRCGPVSKSNDISIRRPKKKRKLLNEKKTHQVMLAKHQYQYHTTLVEGCQPQRLSSQRCVTSGRRRWKWHLNDDDEQTLATSVAINHVADDHPQSGADATSQTTTFASHSLVALVPRGHARSCRWCGVRSH